MEQQKIKILFDYRRGCLYWKIKKQGISIGAYAGHLEKKIGYRRIGIDGKKYLEHRLIFLYHYGYLPKYLDHINGIKDDNRIENLREVTHSQNHMNKKSNKNSTSIYKGVNWDKGCKKWKASIRKNKLKHLGVFISEKEAAQVYNKAAKELFGKYANLNIIK